MTVRFLSPNGGFQMRFLQLPSCTGSNAPFQYLSSFLVNDRVALDAGSLGFWGDVRQQARIRHVFLTHAHLDHVASLPIFVENVAALVLRPVQVYGTDDVLHTVQRDLFNDRVFPDFIRISRIEKPLLALRSLTPGKPLTVAGLRITPIAVDHIVPTMAFIVANKKTAIAYVTDTAPTEAIWERLKRVANLKAIFLEATFPAAQGKLAAISKHLTTVTFAGEVAKAPPGVPIYAIHLKAKYRDQIISEIKRLRLPHVSICERGQAFAF
jgi:ribonuclease BN (tRNA processing enzyme)